ncbi:MAG: chorismate mutase [Anaerolineae bacterium]|nr:chorismate mutase [Anaerolineae bacterium]
MRCLGVRGATTVADNTRAAILEATSGLLTEIITVNGIALEDVASAIFTATPDLDAVYPAAAARELGWTQTPLLCMREMQVAGSLRRCIRVLIHWNTEHAPCEIQHVYLRGAQALRPDLVEEKR